jgi:hypothetical protein
MNAGKASIENALSAAFDIHDRREASRRAKQVVANELRQLDRRLQIKSTGYFTHSYIPDLVAEWRDKGTQFERDVYLRFHLDTPDVEADARALARHKPIFIALARDGVTGSAELTRGAANTLLTQAVALEKFTTPETTSDTLGRIVSSCIVRGGRGLLLEDDAERTTEIAQRGLEVIRSGNRTAATETVSALTSFLGENHAVQLTRFIQTMWLAYGHDIDEFPGEDMLAGHLSDIEVREILSELFEGANINDPPFWRRLGGLLDLTQLEAFGYYPANVNLKNLLSANLDRLRALVLALAPEQLGLFEDDNLRWSIRDRCLALEGPGFVALMASDRRRFSQARETHKLPTWSDFAIRIRSYRVQRLSLVGPTTRMEVEADQIRNLRDADVPSLSSAVHEDMRIKRVLLVSPDTGLSIEADIARWIIDGGEDGVPVGRLAKAGVEILRAPDSELQESLTQFLTEPDADLVATDVLLSNAPDRSDVGTSTDLGGEGQSSLGFE